MELGAGAERPSYRRAWTETTPHAGSRPRLLIVDTGGREVRRLRRQLRKTAPEIGVSVATSVGGAVARLLSVAPDVALVGQTGELSSAEMIRVLRAAQPTLGVVVWNPLDVGALVADLGADDAPLIIARTVQTDRLVGAIQRAGLIQQFQLTAPHEAAPVSEHGSAAASVPAGRGVEPQPLGVQVARGPAGAARHHWEDTHGGAGPEARREAADDGPHGSGSVGAGPRTEVDEPGRTPTAAKWSAEALKGENGVLVPANGCWVEAAERHLRVQPVEVERARSDHAVSLAAISHDVRGALSNIVGFAELLREQPRADDTAELASHIASLAYRSAEMMAELVEYSRATQPLARGTWRSVSARAVVAECVRDAQFQCAQKGLTFQADLPEDGVVSTEPVQLARVIQNLLSNAVRYTPRGSVRLVARLAPTSLQVSVSDTGIGVPTTEIDSVFKAFYRTEAARQMHRLGTGLGLATVKHLCHRLGATLEVDSTPGVGSTFRVTVPRGLCGYAALTPHAA